jgi:NitT/TauT family transport system ATP-binding protein
VVFQGYALFPWLSVLDNIAVGLEIRGIGKTERRRTAHEYLELVGLHGFADRYPHEISGGMKQRVAIARSLAYKPDVLLMDEPFAALDAQTREILQGELLRIWEQYRKTIVFITHSLEEAVYLSDRVAVMTQRPGRIKDIIDIPLARPRSAEVRHFGRVRCVAAAGVGGAEGRSAGRACGRGRSKEPCHEHRLLLPLPLGRGRNIRAASGFPKTKVVQ